MGEGAWEVVDAGGFQFDEPATAEPAQAGSRADRQRVASAPVSG